MFITKKNLDKMIAEAVAKRESELEHEYRLNDEFKNVYDSLDSRCKYIHERIDMLNGRVSSLEKQLTPEKHVDEPCANNKIATY